MATGGDGRRWLLHSLLTTLPSLIDAVSSHRNGSDVELAPPSFKPDYGALLTLGITFPVAVIVGILWCYCMSKICAIQEHKNQLPFTKPPSSGIRTPSYETHTHRRSDSL